MHVRAVMYALQGLRPTRSKMRIENGRDIRYIIRALFAGSTASYYIFLSTESPFHPKKIITERISARYISVAAPRTDGQKASG
jgi:hypothetical protein